jgi:TolB protein
VQLFVSSGWAGFSASSSGTIAFASKQNQARLTWVDRAGRALGIVGSPGDYTNDISLSPDGRTLFASRTDPSSGTYDIWATDLERDTETRVTAGPGTDIAALVTPDRQWMIFSMTTGGSPELYRRNLATGADERLATRESFQSGDAITRDGRTLVYEERTDRGDWDLLSLPLDGAHTPVPLAATTFTECCGRLSPDDRLLAFVSDETGRGEVYLAPFPGMMPKYRVSSQGGRAPHWSADGHELFYLGADGRLTSVTVSLDPALSVGMPATAVAEPPRLQWTDFLPMPDGKRFIAIVPESLSREQPFTVLTHAVR